MNLTKRFSEQLGVRPVDYKTIFSEFSIEDQENMVTAAPTCMSEPSHYDIRRTFVYFVTNPNARLALVVVFIFVFALGLNLTTSVKQDSMFAASAAYAAVLVVFFSDDSANTNVG